MGVWSSQIKKNIIFLLINISLAYTTCNTFCKQTIQWSLGILFKVPNNKPLNVTQSINLLSKRISRISISGKIMNFLFQRKLWISFFKENHEFLKTCFFVVLVWQQYIYKYKVPYETCKSISLSHGQIATQQWKQVKSQSWYTTVAVYRQLHIQYLVYTHWSVHSHIAN